MTEQSAQGRLLGLMQRLAAVAQTGLEFTDNPYDRIRFQEVGAIAEALAAFDSEDLSAITPVFAGETGYATPKLIVRAGVIAEGRILMVREAVDGLWALPGGWIDVGEPLSVAAEREVGEESGYRVKSVKLASVYDQARHGHPQAANHSYLLFVLCDLLGGTPTTSLETTAVEWFAPGRLPPLSLGRVTASQILRMFDHHFHREMPTDFD